MSIIHRSAVVNYTPTKMFQLVDDIEAYPSFLPWCEKAQVHSRTLNEVSATLQLTLGGLSKSFTTCNRLQIGKMIEIRLINGPFKHLEGFWRFEPYEESHCRVIFDLEFEFSNKLLAIPFEPIFQQIAHSLVHAFSKRAEHVYGQR